MKMRLTISMLLIALTTTVMAANVHLKPPKKNPSFTDLGLSLRAAGKLAGLGNGDIVITLTAQADVVSTCTNQGGNQAPGQNPAPITVAGAVSIPEPEVKNGTVAFTIDTVAPDPVIPGAPDCPNPNWTELIEDLSFTSAIISVEQPAGTDVLRVECDFAVPTFNGAVPTGDVFCSVF